MHGPGRADLERSNQAAQEQSAQPEETPPRVARKRAKARPCAISGAAFWSEWTSKPASFSKNWTIAGLDTAWIPAPGHTILEKAAIARRKRSLGRGLKLMKTKAKE
jgi:hypothetical protein